MATVLYPPFDAERFRSELMPLVSLELLSMAHVPELVKFVETDAIWRNPYGVIPKPDAVSEYVETALRDVAKGFTRAFVIRNTALNNTKNSLEKSNVLGCTRFFQLNAQHRRVQIGGTWLASCARRTGLNRAVKWLLLREAFEIMRLQRVEFTVLTENTASRDSLLRLGASFEGVLRQYLNLKGVASDAAMYSLTDSDWLSMSNRMHGRDSAE